MPHVEIPRVDDEPLPVEVEPGEPVFVVGANGSGKSALLLHFATQLPTGSTTRILAHRQMWFPSGVVSLTPAARRDRQEQIRNWDQNHRSRWSDSHGDARLSAAIYDLMAKENSRARRIAGQVDANNLNVASSMALAEQSPNLRINRLLLDAQLPIQIENDDNEQFLARREGASDIYVYSISEMSDGERAAMLLAAQILTAETGQVFLIDEPERHLHRKIAVPLLTALISERKDCSWIISTHELSLPTAFPDSRCLLLRGTTWSGHQATHWLMNILEPRNDLPEDLRQDILGSRQTIVFVEGSLDRIDHQLYEILINDERVTVVPKGSWYDVQRAVIGLQTTTSLHHVRAFGIIDGDGRPDIDSSQLETNNIFVLPCWSIESLLYSKEVRTSVAHAHAETVGKDPNAIVSDMESHLLIAFSRQETRQHLVNARTHRAVIHDIQKRIPSASELETQVDHELHIPVSIPRNNEEKIYDQLVAAKDLHELIVRYPIKESPVLGALCNALGWQGGHQYQQAAIEQIRTHMSLRERLREQLKDLITALSESK